MHPIKLGNRRLLKLTKKLRTRAVGQRFEYGHWVGVDWEGHQNLSCGTSACAFGWAPSIPSFARAGLRLKKLGDDVMVTLKGSKVRRVGNTHENAMNHTLKTAQKFFNLTEDEAQLLFVPATYMNTSDGGYVSSPEDSATAQEVARHIEKFVAKRVKALKKK